MTKPKWLHWSSFFISAAAIVLVAVVILLLVASFEIASKASVILLSSFMLAKTIYDVMEKERDRGSKRERVSHNVSLYVGNGAVDDKNIVVPFIKIYVKLVSIGGAVAHIRSVTLQYARDDRSFTLLPLYAIENSGKITAVCDLDINVGSVFSVLLRNEDYPHLLKADPKDTFISVSTYIGEIHRIGGSEFLENLKEAITGPKFKS